MLSGCSFIDRVLPIFMKLAHVLSGRGYCLRKRALICGLDTWSSRRRNLVATANLRHHDTLHVRHRL